MREYQLNCKVKQFLSYVTSKYEKRKIILLNRNFVSFLYNILFIKQLVKIFLTL